MCIKQIQLPTSSLPATKPSDLPGNQHKVVMQVLDLSGVCIHQGCQILFLEIYIHTELIKILISFAGR